MRAGKLDKRVRFEVRAAGTPAQDPETGEPNYVWTEVATVWASKMDRGARERFAQITSQVMAEVDTVFETRWHPFGASLQPDTYRIIYPIAPAQERVWNIVGIAEIKRREGLQIAASARAEGPIR